MSRTKHVQTDGFKPGDLIWKGAGTAKVLILDDHVPAMTGVVYRVCRRGRRQEQKLMTPKELEVLGYWKCGHVEEGEAPKKREKRYGVDKVNGRIESLKRKAKRHQRRKAR